MDHADDRDGVKRWSKEFTLEDARLATFTCTYCLVPMFAAKMPKSVSAAPQPRHKSPSPQLYFTARPAAPHLYWCGPDVVRAVISEKTVASRSGRSGEPPSIIQLRTETVRMVDVADDGREGDHPRRTRSVDDGVDRRRRGPRATTVSHIQRACEAYAIDPGIGRARLVAPEFLPATSNTYDRVFQPLRRAATSTAAAIWFDTLRFTSKVRYGEEILHLETFGGIVTINRTGWPDGLPRRFDAELRIVMDEAGRRWREDRDRPLHPTIFALAPPAHRNEGIIASDFRLISILLLDRSLRLVG